MEAEINMTCELGWLERIETSTTYQARVPKMDKKMKVENERQSPLSASLYHTLSMKAFLISVTYSVGLKRQLQWCRCSFEQKRSDSLAPIYLFRCDLTLRRNCILAQPSCHKRNHPPPQYPRSCILLLFPIS
jgi:hypothetical protein